MSLRLRILILGLAFQHVATVWADVPTRDVMAAELRRQDAAWDDLDVHYRFESEIRTDNGTWKTDPVLRLRWLQTQQGWQRVRRERDVESGVWVEEASHDGEFFMAGDSQGVGSGSIGHQTERFLYNSYVPRLFGLAVTGQELGQPLSVAEFLMSEGVSVRPGDQGRIHVEGPDPFAEGVTLALELDPALGYRPVQLRIFDKKGPLSTYDDLRYRKLKGERGEFWFPESGIWKGIDPRDRSDASRLTYRADEIHVDTKPTRSDFILTYRTGTLLLNTDTGETIYLTADSTPADAPHFQGKRMSLAEHDRQARRSIDAPQAKASRWNLWIACNLLGAAVILIVIFARPARKKRDV